MILLPSPPRINEKKKIISHFEERPVKIGEENKIPEGTEKDGTFSKNHCLLTYDWEKVTFINILSDKKLELIKGSILILK